MISPESLRKYPYFAGISPDSLKDIAVLSDERDFKSGDVLFEESGGFIGESKLYEKGREATHLLVVTSGKVDLTYTLGIGDPVTIGSVVAGELLGLSALVPPYHLTTNAVATSDGSAIYIEADGLRDLLDDHPELGYLLYKGVSKALVSRLQDTRVELAATRA